MSEPLLRIEGRSEPVAREAMSGAPTYRKVALVHALELHGPVDIETPEGVMHAERGDFLVSDNPPTHLWPVKRAIFLATYERESIRDAAVRLGIPVTEHAIPPDVLRPGPFAADYEEGDE